MDFNNELDEYEKNVQSILNDGFKMLIDNVNETLSQLLQSTITSAENVENGLKREFQALLGNISNTQVLEDLNAAIPTAEVEEDEYEKIDFEIPSANPYQYQPSIGSVSPGVYDTIDSVKLQATNHAIDDEYVIDSKFFLQEKLELNKNQSTKSSFSFKEPKPKSDKSSLSFNKSENYDDLETNNTKNNEPTTANNASNKSKDTEQSPVNSAPAPPKIVNNNYTYRAPPQPQTQENKELIEQRKNEEMEQRKKKFEEMEARRKKFEEMDKNPQNTVNVRKFACIQCRYFARDMKNLRRHVSEMAKKGLHKPYKNVRHDLGTLEY